MVPGLRYSQPAGRWVLFATVLGSGLAFIDGTVVNIALPHIGDQFDAGAAALQWTVNAYTLTLASFVLLGGSLGDRFGRRRVFVIGVTWFALASLLCGLAPSVGLLIAARALQGVGAALLTPGSLAILQSSFATEDRMRAIGAWSGLAGVAGAIGPFLGGWLVEVASWRLVFLINLPLALVVVLVAMRHVPESSDPDAAKQLDFAGAALGAIALGGLTFGFTAWPGRGGTDPIVLSSLDDRRPRPRGLPGQREPLATPDAPARRVPVAHVQRHEHRDVRRLCGARWRVLPGRHQPPGGRRLSTAEGRDLVAAHHDSHAAAVRAVRSAGHANRPRIPMTVGPLLSAVGLVLLSRVGADATYVTDVLPGVVVLGLGLSATVAPLTATALASVEDRHAGIASGVNNAVARIAGCWRWPSCPWSQDWARASRIRSPWRPPITARCSSARACS